MSNAGSSTPILLRLSYSAAASPSLDGSTGINRAAFTFVGRSFRFVVNGRTGEVHGERPWSFWKIAGAVVLAVLLFLLLALLFSQAEGLQDVLGGGR